VCWEEETPDVFSVPLLLYQTIKVALFTFINSSGIRSNKHYNLLFSCPSVLWDSLNVS